MANWGDNRYQPTAEDIAKMQLEKAIDMHNSKLPEGKKESLKVMCAYILEGNYK